MVASGAIPFLVVLVDPRLACSAVPEASRVRTLARGVGESRCPRCEPAVFEDAEPGEMSLDILVDLRSGETTR